MESGLEKSSSAIPLLEARNVDQYFREACKELKIKDSDPIFHQIEEWMADGTLLGDILSKYIHAGSLRSFSKRVTKAIKNKDTYQRLKHSDLYQKIYQINPEAARPILVFATGRPKGQTTERLEVEVGRWGVHNFKRDKDNYFFRQDSSEFSNNLKRDNAILKNGTAQVPNKKQYEIIKKRSLKHLGRIFIGLRNFEYKGVKKEFEDRLPEKNSLTLQNYSNAVAHLETFCPKIFKYCESLIKGADQGDPLFPVHALYFEGTVIRVLYPSVKCANQVNSLTSEGEPVSLETRLINALVLERLKSPHPPKTSRPENKELWKKIDGYRWQKESPDQILKKLSEEEKEMIAHEKIRALARASQIKNYEDPQGDFFEGEAMPTALEPAI